MSSQSDRFAPDPYGQWDAAYVLGALSPEDRRDFEGHLAGCTGCQTAVAELAGLPGMLAQVSPDDAAAFAESAGVADPAPRSLMPPLTPDAANRRGLVRALVALAAALVLFAGVVGVAGLRGGAPVIRSSASGPVRLAFVPVVPSAITAVVDVVPVADGTRLNVECQYGESNAPLPGQAYAEYAIYVTDRAGNAILTKTWKAKPNRVMRPEGTTTLPLSKIAAVEIRAVETGQTLLRASLG